MTERRKALITGASRGIGRAICVKLASEGTDIVFSYRSGDEAASETVNLCREYGIEIHAIKADVSNSEECERLIREAVDLLGGRIDILVNNAGITKEQILYSVTVQVMRLPVKQLIYAESMELKSMQLRQM